jgi:hypothetical protein
VVHSSTYRPCHVPQVCLNNSDQFVLPSQVHHCGKPGNLSDNQLSDPCELCCAWDQAVPTLKYLWV